MIAVTTTSKQEYLHTHNETIEYYHIKSKRVKTSEIIVDDGKIVIRTPYHKPLSEIENLIKRKGVGF
jgi:predicted metal-dependent hydrolase